MLWWLAPMDWFTDSAFRTVTKYVLEKYKSKDSLFLFSEFMSADGYVNNPKWVCKHILKTDFEDNLIVQIFGWNEENLIKTAQDLDKKYDLYWIDLNLWCPSGKIISSWWGIGMLKDRSQTLQTIKKISKNINKPLSIKTRVWLDENDKDKQFDFILNASEFCKMISIHGRTLKQWHSWNVDWEFIYKIKEKVWKKCKIIWNGGIKSYQDWFKKNNNLDWIMIWQAAIWNPWIFVDKKPQIKEIYEIIKFHLKLSTCLEVFFESSRNEKNEVLWTFKLDDIEKKRKEVLKKEQGDQLRTPVEFRKHLFCYVKSLPNSKTLKQNITKIKCLDWLIKEIDNFFEKQFSLF